MVLKLQLYAKTTCLCAFFILLSYAETKAQTIETSTKSNVARNYPSYNGSFQKAESFFFKEYYAQCLVEIKNTPRADLNEYESSIIGFYEAVSSAYMQKGEAVQIIKKYITLNKNIIYNNIALTVLGQNLLESGRAEEAIETFKEVDTKTLNKIIELRYNFYYAKALFESEMFLEAKFRLSKIEKPYNQYANDISYFLSYIKYYEKDYEGAMAEFTELSLNDKYDKLSIYIAQLKFQHGDYKFIVDNIHSLLEQEKDENKVELYRISGESYFALKNSAEAVVWLDKYIEAGGVLSVEHRYIIGYSHYMNNMYKQAIEYFTQIIEGDDQMTQNAYYHLADSYLKTDDKMGALRAFSMAATLDYDKNISEDALYNQVKLTYETGGGNVYSQLMELMERFMAKYPNSEHNEEIKGYLLSIYINTSDYYNAAKAIEMIENPSDEVLSALQRMRYELAISSFNQKNYPEAIELLNETIYFNINTKYNTLALYWKAEAMYRLGDTSQETIDIFKKFMRLSTPLVKENIFARYSLGYIEFNNKQWDSANQMFKDFIELYDTSDIYSADAMERLGDIAFGKSDYQEAIKYYSQVKEHDQKNKDYADYQIAESWGLSNNLDKKSEKLKEIASSQTSAYKDLATIDLAAIYNRSNRYALSEQTLNDYVKYNVDSPYYTYALLELAIANANQNKNKEALKYYKKIATMYPNSPEANDALVAIKSIYIAEGNVTPYFDFMKSINMDSEIDSSEKEKLSFQALQHQYMANKSESVVELAKKYRNQYPNGSNRNDVTYYYAESLMKTSNDSKALEEFKKIIALPNNPYTVSSLIFSDRIYSKSNDLKNRYECNEKIYQYSNDAKTKFTALDNVMTISLNLKDYKKIENSYNLVFKHKGAPKEILSLAHFARAKQAFEKKDYVTAFADLRKSRMPITSAEGAEGEYMKAVILFSEKKYDDTEEFVMTFSKRDTPHQYWVAKCFILLGDVYVAREDLFQAKATYQSIVEGYDNNNDGIIELAKKKVEELGSLETTNQQTK